VNVTEDKAKEKAEEENSFQVSGGSKKVISKQ